MYGKVLAMFRSYRAGEFDPDSSAVDRVLQTAATWVSAGVQIETQDLNEVSHSSDEEEQPLLGSPPLADMNPCQPRELFPNIETQEVVVRKKSGIAHCLLDSSATVCGPHLSPNYGPLELFEAYDLERCLQCGKKLDTHDHPECFKRKIKMAELSEDQLSGTARWRRKALIARRPQTEEPGFAEHLMETAEEEVDLGFLQGPFKSEDEVSAVLGHDDWSVMRRFVIQQGPKLRPVDDGLEAQLNAAYTSTICLELQDADYVIALTTLLGETPGMNWKVFGLV